MTLKNYIETEELERQSSSLKDFVALQTYLSDNIYSRLCIDTCFFDKKVSKCQGHHDVEFTKIPGQRSLPSQVAGFSTSEHE
jgi:hypothetical protein